MLINYFVTKDDLMQNSDLFFLLYLRTNISSIPRAKVFVFIDIKMVKRGRGKERKLGKGKRSGEFKV